MIDQTWEERGACRDYEPEMWFDRERQRTAQDICLRCPVARECLAFAVKTSQPVGVWGALTPQGRQAWQNLRGVA